MKKLLVVSVLMISFAMFSSFTSQNTEKYQNLLGTWEYIAEDAPYEYSEGDITFKTEDGELTGEADIQGYKIELDELVVEDETVSFIVTVEGEDVSVKMNIDGTEFKGTASFSQGKLPFSGKKVK